ncbi:hypothetical protein GIB67_037159 [Kingdonia uniflora]|uniref:Uncharacterized protein n=1 Tax=Kingdonia uniflora TaxID=39325 RepID=A0A7J7MRT5_9MAGN|nr:hypothetical protein GIB67_037159 [Kingdonia uniflora]
MIRHFRFTVSYSFYSLGQVQNARRHLCLYGQCPDPDELPKLQAVERHIRVCADARMAADWNNVLREEDAVIAAGAFKVVFSTCLPWFVQLFACRAESFLKLQRLEDAESSLNAIPELGRFPTSCSQTKFFEILSEAYMFFVRVQVAMALELFKSAVVDAEKAELIDPNKKKVSMFLHKMRMVSRAHTRGNDHFKSGCYTEACLAYGEGLMLDPTNSVLFCNRAASWSRLEQWERSIEDCNEALRIKPNYTKALLRRATSSAKVQAVKDYGVLSKQLNNDIDVAYTLFHAEAALRKSGEEKGPSLQSGRKVQKILKLYQLKGILSCTGEFMLLLSVIQTNSSSHSFLLTTMLFIRFSWKLTKLVDGFVAEDYACYCDRSSENHYTAVYIVHTENVEEADLLRNWMDSCHIDTVELTDARSNLPDISMPLMRSDPWRRPRGGKPGLP